MNDHFLATIPSSICLAACSKIDSSAPLYFKPSSLMPLELSTVNLRPKKPRTLREGPWPLFLMPSASMGLVGMLQCSPYLARRSSKTWSVLVLNPETMYLFPLASAYSRALTWATATSLTSTAAYSVAGEGMPGYPPLRISRTKASEELPCFEKAGPVTMLGKTLINSSSSLCFSASCQKSFSAKNLLLGQWCSKSSWDQSSSLASFPSVRTITVRQLDVKINLLTLFLRLASMTFLVPSTAGLMSSSSCWGMPGGMGEATWMTLVTPYRATSQLPALRRSAQRSSRCYLAWGSSQRKAYFSLLARLRTVPTTWQPLIRSSLITWEAMYPDAPLTKTLPDISSIFNIKSTKNINIFIFSDHFGNIQIKLSLSYMSNFTKPYFIPFFQMDSREAQGFQKGTGVESLNPFKICDLYKEFYIADVCVSALQIKGQFLIGLKHAFQSHLWMQSGV